MKNALLFNKAWKYWSIMIFSILISFQAKAETVYISSFKAKITDEPKFKADAIINLQKGDKVTVLSKKGAWLKVKTQNNQTGWLSKFLTKKNPPNDRITVLPSDSKVALQDVRRRTSTITTAAAARGLSTLENPSDEDKFKSDPEAVKYMESLQINPRELRSFASEIVEGAK